MRELEPTGERKLAPENGCLNVRSKCCKNCLFGPKPLIPWRPYGIEKIKQIAAADSHFTCHEYDNVMCKGYFDRFKSSLWYIRLARYQGMIRWIDDTD